MKAITGAIIGAIVLGIIGLLLGTGEAHYYKKSEKELVADKASTLFGIVGAALGLFLGAAIGNKIDEEAKAEKVKLEQDRIKELQIAEQSRIRVEQYQQEQQRLREMDAAIGIDNTKDNIYKVGKFWIGETLWIHPSTNKEHSIVTRRNDIGQIISEVDGVQILIHNTLSANKDTIPECHAKAKRITISKLRNAYINKTAKT